MKLKLAILSAFLVSNVASAAPSIKVNLGGGYVRSGFKGKAAQAFSFCEAENCEKKVEKDAEVAADADFAKSGNGLSGIVTADVMFKKESMFFGLNLGGVFAKSWATAHILEGENKITVKRNMGLMGMLGAMAGYSFSDKMSASLGCAVTLQSVSLTYANYESKESKLGDKKDFKPGVAWGVMPSLMLNYKFTDMFGAFVLVGHNFNLSECKQEGKENEKQGFGPIKSAGLTGTSMVSVGASLYLM